MPALNASQIDIPGVEHRRPAAKLLPQAFAAALFLFAIYWLTASGSFHSVDEHVVFATARNLAYHGRLDQSTLFWGSPYAGLGLMGTDGELYSKYGIGHSALVVPTIMLARVIPGAGLATTTMMLNMVATALAAFFLILTAGKLGYSSRTSVSVGLLYGLATFSWVYAKTMFSEPLVALGWIVAVWLVVPQVTRRRALLAGFALAITVSVRPGMVLAAVPFCLLVWDRKPSELVWRLAAFLLPVAIVSFSLLTFNLQRFGDPFQFGYSETFNGSIVVGVTGFLFSLDRSIFIFAPPLVGLLWSVPGFIRRHSSLGWKLLVISGSVFLLYSMWPVFWGGPVWGPRYLLPILPLLMVLLLPAVERAWTQSGWPRIAMIVLTLAGLAIQLPGVVWNSLAMAQALGQRYPLWLLRPQAQWLDVAWLRARPEALLMAAVMALLALAALRWPRRRLLGLAVATTVLGSVLLLRMLGQSWSVENDLPGYTSTLSHLSAEGRPGDGLVLNPAPYQSPLEILAWFMNQPQVKVPFYGVYRLPVGEDAPSSARVDRLLRQHSRLWLLTEGVQLGDPSSTTERHLLDRAALAGSWWQGGGYRLTLFEAPSPPIVTGEANTPLDEAVILESWEVGSPSGNPASFQLSIRWRTLGPTQDPLHVFAQALDENGTLIAGWDGVPGGGFAPSMGWEVEGSVKDRIALRLPDDWQSGPLRLVAGMYNTTTGERLRSPDGSDAVLLATLTP